MEIWRNLYSLAPTSHENISLHEESTNQKSNRNWKRKEKMEENVEPDGATKAATDAETV